MNNEKRTHERVSTNLSARWHGASGAHHGRVEDLSLSGCFINTQGVVDVGEKVMLLIQLPSGDWLPLRGKVTVYHQLTGFSVSFLPADDKEREAVQQLVATQRQSVEG
jgi:Tfp pilus assembly protein PilZ